MNKQKLTIYRRIINDYQTFMDYSSCKFVKKKKYVPVLKNQKTKFSLELRIL